MNRDTWKGETPEEKARRLMRLIDYANAVTAHQMAMEKLEALAGKTKKEGSQSWLGSRSTSISTKT